MSVELSIESVGGALFEGLPDALDAVVDAPAERVSHSLLLPLNSPYSQAFSPTFSLAQDLDN